MKKLNLLFLLFIFLSSPLFFTQNINLSDNPHNILINNNDPIKKPNLSYNPNVLPIYINENSDWASLESSYDWCSGSGTWNDPYIISDIILDNSVSEPEAIHIENSDVYFRLENITIDGDMSFMKGIFIHNTKNGILNRVNVTNLMGNALYMEDSTNITVHNSTIKDVYDTNDGIYLENCSYIVVNTTSFSYITRDGIRFVESDNNTITNNQFNGIFSQAIDLYLDSNKNNFTHNLIELTGWHGGSGGDGSIGGSNGIYIYQSSKNNTFHHNIIRFSMNRGLVIENDLSNTHNLFYNNIFDANGIQFGYEKWDYNAIDLGSNNYFNNSMVGNLWDSYIGYDLNNDGIGDKPFNITDTNLNVLAQDYKPLYNWTTKWKENYLFINDTDINNNWIIANNSKEWLNGSGTINRPYIINNVTFSLGSRYSNGIEILNSNSSFVISNCSFSKKFIEDYFEYYNLYLKNTSNGIIKDCCFYNTYKHLYFVNTTNITFIQNNISNVKNSWSSSIVLKNATDTKLIENNIRDLNSAIEFKGIISKIDIVKNSFSNIPYIINDFYETKKISNANFSQNLFTNTQNLILKNGINISFSFNNFSTISLRLSNTNRTAISNNNFNSIITEYSFPLIEYQYSKNFTIYENLFENGYQGLRIYECFNFSIQKNRFFNSSYESIDISDCTNISIIENHVWESNRGIEIEHSSSLIFSENEISNSNEGVSLSDIQNATLFKNKIHNNNNTAINLNQDCNFNEISGNNLTYNGQSILLLFSENNTITNNLLCNNNKDSEIPSMGVALVGSHGNIIENNNISHNTHGLLLLGSNENKIRKNHFYNNTDLGVAIGFDFEELPLPINPDSDYNLMENNLIKNNKKGLIIQFSDYNIIKNNTIDSNLEEGILLSESSSYNTLLLNNISSNNYGIYLSDKNDLNTIRNNTIYNNTAYGLFIPFQSDYNLISCNNFTLNGVNAEDYGSYNDWDDGIIGNIWSDYGGIDDNDDNIGDTPYLIGGTANSYDRFPIFSDGLDIMTSFTIFSNADELDDDGKFTITWTASNNSVSYSIYYSEKAITTFNPDSLTLYARDITELTIEIELTKNGKFFFVVVAVNKHNTILLSENNIVVEIDIEEYIKEESDYTIPITIALLSVFGLSVGGYIFYTTRKKRSSIKFL